MRIGLSTPVVIQPPGMAFVAARTSRIRLATSVIVLGDHHPLAIAKRYGTLDRLGAAWDDRGAHADDAIRALRASLSTTSPSYSGEFFRYASMVVDPCAVQQRVPIWVGGRSMRSLRRAVELGDGCAPSAPRPSRAR